MNTSESAPESKKPAALDVFAVTQFRWLFFGNVAFFFAMQGQMLTRTLLAWELTGEATSLAYINLVVAFPLIFASVLGGAITDRVERRQLIIFGQTLITANEVFILILLLLGKLEFWHMLCTAFVAGCAFPFIMPARMAITMKVVGSQRLQSAMGFQSGAMNLNRILGPAVMGLIVAQFSYEAAYYLSTALYSLAIVCMFGVDRSRSDESGAKKKPLLEDIALGFSYIRANRPVLICLLFGLLPMFLAMPFQNILVMLAEQAWNVSESGVGTMMATGGAGGVVGALWVVKRGDNAGRMKMMLGSTIAFGVCLAIFVLTPVFTIALFPLLAANVFANASQTVNNAAIQLLVEDRMRGRMSSFMMLSFGLTPIGVFPMAVVADKFGAVSAILGASALLIAITVVFFLLSKTLRALDRSIEGVMLARTA
ncbi:MAG: MFS transporter [Pseudomonadota bacterium]|nr:MFS transporter [Pseudomonadota bacterium]